MKVSAPFALLQPPGHLLNIEVPAQPWSPFPQAPHQDAHHAHVPPSPTPKPNRSPGPRTGTRREASVGRPGAAGRCLRNRPKSASPKPRPAPMVGTRSQPTRTIPRRGMPRVRGRRASPLSPGGSCRPGRVRTVGRRLWPRCRWGWRPGQPLPVGEHPSGPPGGGEPDPPAPQPGPRGYPSHREPPSTDPLGLQALQGPAAPPGRLHAVSGPL